MNVLYVASTTSWKRKLYMVSDKQHNKADKGKAMVSYGKADYTSAKEGMPSWWGMPTWWKHADLPGVKVGMRGATRNGKQRSGHQVSCICFMNRLCRVSWCTRNSRDLFQHCPPPAFAS